MLLFKKKFLDAIRAGDKTQTIRLWPYRRMRVGQRSYIPGVAYILVDAVDQVELADLTADDAVRDGFADLPQLQAEIREIYAEQLAGGYHVFRVRFHVLPAAEQQRKTPRKPREKS